MGEAHSSSSPSHSLPIVKKGLGGLGHLPKITIGRGGAFELKSIGGELV